jgi:glycosyltransferase involved in cell wall biosynthesis
MIKTILMTSYDINPYRGSESGTGWHFSIQASRFNKVIAITRNNNKANIEKYITEFDIDESNIKFMYFDLPYYLRFWKRGARGSALYFYLWQMFMPLFIKNKKIKFDIAHNVNFHADAFPTFLWVLGKPTVWGPINHNEKIPKAYVLSKNTFFKDRLKWLIKNFNWKLDPFMLLAKKKCSIIIGGNSSVQKRLNIPNERFKKLTQVASENQNVKPRDKDDDFFTVLVVGRFLTIKSFEIAILAFDNFYKNLNEQDRKLVKLKIIGEGETDLKNIALKLNSRKHIDFIGWVDKHKMNSFYQKSSIFLFPSHEGAGMVVVEALGNGLPVVCFDNYGPGELIGDNTGFKIPYTTYDESVNNFATSLMDLFKNKELYAAMSSGARKHFENHYTWDSKGFVLKEIYDSLQ